MNCCLEFSSFTFVYRNYVDIIDILSSISKRIYNLQWIRGIQITLTIMRGIIGFNCCHFPKVHMNERAKKKYHYKRSARVWLELGTAASPELSDNFWRVISRDGANITDIIGSKGGWKKNSKAMTTPNLIHKLEITFWW